MTLHSAFTPQRPGHGSIHFWFMQDSVFAHSELVTHSGLQFGGDPTKLILHVHEGMLPLALHSELGPQGDG